MECPNCKKTYDEKFNFCPWCGSEKPEINYDEDLESFERENKILDDETTVFEKQFRNIEEELNILQEDIKNYEQWVNNNDELETIDSYVLKKGKDYDDNELKVLYEDVFEKEGYDYSIKEESYVSSSDIRCPNCGSRKFLSDYDRGEVVCTRCGLLVNEHLLDMGRPWMYTNEKNSREHLKFY